MQTQMVDLGKHELLTVIGRYCCALLCVGVIFRFWSTLDVLGVVYDVFYYGDLQSEIVFYSSK